MKILLCLFVCLLPPGLTSSRRPSRPIPRPVVTRQKPVSPFPTWLRYWAVPITPLAHDETLESPSLLKRRTIPTAPIKRESTVVDPPQVLHPETLELPLR